MPDALPGTTLPIYHGLGQASNMLACIPGGLAFKTDDDYAYGLFSWTTWVSWHQNGKPFWILMKQETIGGSDIS